MSEEAKKLGALGGKRRAANLTKAQRSDAARKAAMARWGGELPVAAHSGTLVIGDLPIPCSVLADGTRVVSEAGFTKALGRARSGTAWMRGNDPGARMPHYAPPKNLIEFIGNDLANELMQPIKYVSVSGGKVGYGVKAALIPQICEAWLRARDAGKLNRQQQRTAAQAEVLMRALAHVGIIALVDEATGYQEVRQKNALAEILEKFISKELRKWVRRFPFAYYEHIFRLKRWDTSELTPNSPKPLEVGRITDDLIYRRLAPGVRAELRRLTPRNEKGYLSSKLHQRLTDDIGNPKLEKHIAITMALMEISPDWPTFMGHVNRVLPPFNKNYELPLGDARDSSTRLHVTSRALSAGAPAMREADEVDEAEFEILPSAG
ncbi:hypothetical protein tb265_11820 [Gemmatimonadetes bacterium T265]|nr:hypothetical protein tb265_11820 [Gemmatimonadetes bacterium T265]